MADRLLRITMERTCCFKYEQKSQIEIVKYQDGSYYSKYTWNDSAVTKQTIKKQMTASEVENIMATLSALHIPAFPEYEMGCGGGFTELEVGGYIGKSCYRWWRCPPVGWEELDEVTQGIIDLIADEED